MGLVRVDIPLAGSSVLEDVAMCWKQVITRMPRAFVSEGEGEEGCEIERGSSAHTWVTSTHTHEPPARIDLQT